MLSLKEIAIGFGNQHLLKNITFSVDAGERVGVLGRNGCGKTTLFKILSNAEKADSGELAFKKGIRVGYLSQEVYVTTNETVLDHIQSGVADLIDNIKKYEEGEGSEAELSDILHQIEAVDGWNLDSRIKSLAQSLSVPSFESPMQPLSGGEKRRVALCRALVAQPDLLLLDEPTNHLDAATISWLEDYLVKFAGALLFVTHDRHFLDQVATRVIEIADGFAYSHEGNYTAYLEAKAERQANQEMQEVKRQRFLRKELEWVRAGVKARGTKQRSRLDQYYEIANQDGPNVEQDMVLTLPEAPSLGDIAIQAEKLGHAFSDDFGNTRWLFSDLDLTLEPGTCTGIVGPNGSGKTTLLKLSMGQIQPTEGKITIGKKVVFNLIDQARLSLNDEASLMEEIADQDDIVFFGNTKMNVRSYLRQFLFQDDRMNEKISLLSGGERARLLLAKVMKRGGNVLIFDEPTNDLDLSSLRILEEAILEFKGAVIVVSHDRWFLDRICDQMLVFEPDGLHFNSGNYSYYLEKRAQRQANLAAASAAKIKADQRAKRERERKLTFKEKEELAQMQQQIESAEAAHQGLQAKLDDPIFYANPDQPIATILKSLENQEKMIQELYSRWELLESIATSEKA
jgi:ATP-binding cassette subfamily F protein uup